MVQTHKKNYLCRSGHRHTLWLRAGKALDFTISNLELKVFLHASLAVDMLTLFEEQRLGTQILREADSTAKNLAIKNLLLLNFIKIQQLG